MHYKNYFCKTKTKRENNTEEKDNYKWETKVISTSLEQNHLIWLYQESLSNYSDHIGEINQ